MQRMVLQRGCYAREKATPKAKAWIAAPKPEKVQSFGFRNKVRKLNRGMAGGEGGRQQIFGPLLF